MLAGGPAAEQHHGVRGVVVGVHHQPAAGQEGHAGDGAAALAGRHPAPLAYPAHPSPALRPGLPRPRGGQQDQGGAVSGRGRGQSGLGRLHGHRPRHGRPRGQTELRCSPGLQDFQVFL